MILELTNLNEVDFGKSLVISWFLDVENGDDVLMIEIPQQLHFS